MAKYYIDREALEIDLNHRLNFLMDENGEYDHYTSGFDEAVTRVENFPSADVAPVRHGHWIYHPDDLFPNDSTQECSYCHAEESLTLYNENYCPNCGAKMDG